MNDTLANQLTHTLQQLEQQLPGLGEQLVGYALTVSLFWFSVGLAVAVLCGYKAHFNRTTSDDWDNLSTEDKERRQLIVAGWLLLALAGLLVMALNLEWIKVWLYPKVYLLEYLFDKLQTLKSP